MAAKHAPLSSEQVDKLWASVAKGSSLTPINSVDALSRKHGELLTFGFVARGTHHYPTLSQRDGDREF